MLNDTIGANKMSNDNDNYTDTELDYNEIDTADNDESSSVIPHILTAITQTLTGWAIILAWSAEQWLTAGHGLNPFIALPIATVALLLPYTYSRVTN